jgi:hypothetical protein
MPNRVVKKVFLPRVPPKNYEVSLSDGGDCGACVIAGVLNISIEEAYELHCSGEYYGGKPIPKISSWNRQSMRRTLECLADNWGNQLPAPLFEHVVTDCPIWPFDSPHTSVGMGFGLTAGMQFSPWADYIRAMLMGGFYGITTVFNNGYHGEIRHYGQTDHWVMIKGWQYVFVQNEDPKTKELSSGHYSQEICIGNSARNSPQEEWMDLGDFLKYWGGFGAMWAKPMK